MAAFVQSAVGGADANAATVASGSFTSTAGNALIVAVYFDISAGGSLTTVADNKGNPNFTLIGSVFQDVNTEAIQHGYLLNFTTGGAGHVVTANFSAPNPGFRRIIVHEVSGILTSGAFDKDSGGKGQSGTSLTDNAVVPTTDGQYIFATIMNDGGTATETFIAGGSFTEQGTAQPAANEAMAEYLVQSTAASVTAAFTRSGIGGQCCMRTSTFKALAADAGPALMGQVWM